LGATFYEYQQQQNKYPSSNMITNNDSELQVLIEQGHTILKTAPRCRPSCCACRLAKLEKELPNIQDESVKKGMKTTMSQLRHQVTKGRKRMADQRNQNPEKFKTQQKEWRDKNPEYKAKDNEKKALQYGDEYYKKTHEIYLANYTSEYGKQYQKEWRKANPEYMKQYQKANREKINLQKREYYHKNKEHKNKERRAKLSDPEKKEKIKEQKKKWHENNKEKEAKRLKEYRENNKEKISKQKKEYYQKKKEKVKNALKIQGAWRCYLVRVRHQQRTIFCAFKKELGKARRKYLIRNKQR